MSKLQITEVIERPEYFKRMPDGRIFAFKIVQNREITVIYREEEKYIKIITVM